MRLIDADEFLEVAIRHADLGGTAVVYPADIGAAPSIHCEECVYDMVCTCELESTIGDPRAVTACSLFERSEQCA